MITDGLFTILESMILTEFYSQSNPGNVHCGSREQRKCHYPIGRENHDIDNSVGVRLHGRHNIDIDTRSALERGHRSTSILLGRTKRFDRSLRDEVPYEVTGLLVNRRYQEKLEHGAASMYRTKAKKDV